MINSAKYFLFMIAEVSVFESAGVLVSLIDVENLINTKRTVFYSFRFSNVLNCACASFFMTPDVVSCSNAVIIGVLCSSVSLFEV